MVADSDGQRKGVSGEDEVEGVYHGPGSLYSVRRSYIEHVLAEVGNDLEAAAGILGISADRVRSLTQRLDIETGHSCSDREQDTGA